MSGRHRRPGARAAMLLTALASGAAIATGMTLGLAGPAPVLPESAPAPAARVQQVDRPSMVVYDDNPRRGERRCDAWRSLYIPDTTVCVVMPTADGPVPQRARDGQDWWAERYPDDGQSDR